MDRTEFLTKMFRMYPNSFNEFNIADWMEAYKAVLSDSRIDYERLFQTMIRKWNSTTVDRTLYEQVRQVLELNKRERHIRGGMATRQKYKGTP